MTRYGVPATLRASFAVYNDDADVDQLLGAVARVRKMFG
jgi:cysteine desulfurase/selenocysteine lyase